MQQCADWARHTFVPEDCAVLPPSDTALCEEYNSSMQRITTQMSQEDMVFCQGLAANTSPPACDQVPATVAQIQNLQQMIAGDKLAIAWAL